MRYLALLVLLAAIPAFVAMLRSSRGYSLGCLLIGLLPFSLNAMNLDFAIIDWAAWPGYVKGLVITILDSLSIAFLIVHNKKFSKLPFLGVFFLFIIAESISVLSSTTFLGSAFYPWQLLRVFILFVAASLAAQRPSGLAWLSYGLAAAAILEAAVTVSQRLGGTFQAHGTMAHQNMLGFMLHFVTLPLFALALAGSRSRLVLLGVASALLAVALGASRATIGFLALGLVLLAALSLLRKSTPSKWKVIGIGLAAAALVAPIAMSGLEQRFASPGIEGSDEERAAFERAAKLMIQEHPWGVGANNYVVIANVGGYSERAGVIWNQGSRAAHVHNMYLLTAAESGWFGLLALVALFAWPAFCGLRFAIANRKDSRGDIVLGAAIAVVVAAMHGLYEWIFVTYQAQYMFAIALGIIAGVLRQTKYEKKRLSRARARAAARPSDRVEGEEGCAEG